MAKYKVGDKVRIKKVEECEHSFAWNHDGKMDHWCGQIMTIRSIYNEISYEMEEDINENDGGWSWSESWIEPVTSFAKDDLRTGMTVKTRDSGILLVYEDHLLNLNGFEPICNYFIVLTNREYSDLGIEEVYDINKKITALKDLLDHPGKLIWKRKEEREISSEEAFKILKEHYGCDVKIKE